MKPAMLWRLLPLALGLWGSTVSAQFVLTDKDKVLFYGDSAVYPPKVGLYIEQFVALRYPQLKARFLHAAPFSRPTADAGAADYERVTADYKPTWVVLSFGGFETAGKPYKPELLERFVQSMSELITSCKAGGAQVALLTPPRPEIEQKDLLKGLKYDEIIAAYTKALVDLAGKNDCLLLDWNAAMKTFVEANTKEGAAPKLTRDGVVPSDEAIGLAVDLLLTAWKAEPLTASIEVDWSQGTATGKGCQAEWLVPQEGDIRMLRVVGLPPAWPLSGRKNPFPNGSVARRWVQLPLRIINTPAASISLSTQNSAAWNLSREELERGYDLTNGSPLFDLVDARIVYDRIEKKNDAHRSLSAFDRRQKKDQVPEPELAPAYESHRRAWILSIDGWNQVLDRTPRTLDVTFVLTPGQ